MRDAIAMPKNIRVIVDEIDESSASYRDHAAPSPRLRIDRIWRSRAVVFAIAFCAFWDAAVVLMYVQALRGPGPSWGLLFSIFHVAIGAYLTYWTLCALVNRTRITVARGVLSVRHLPLPWPGGGTCVAREIDDLYCEERRGRRGTIFYDLCARFRSGRTGRLLMGLATREEVLVVERLLEERLGIGGDASIRG
jgi:hypothetical protein